MRLSGKLILFIGIVVAVVVIVYMTTSSYQRGSYYNYGLGLFEYKLKSYENAARYFERAYVADQDNLMALYFQARSKVMLGEKGKMLQNEVYFRQASHEADELTKAGEKRGNKNLYLFYYILARAHFDLKEYNAANEAIEKAIKIKARDYQVQVLYGRILLGLKQYDGAINVLIEAAELENVKPYEAYFYLAQAYEYTGNNDKAWYYYDQAGKAWPTREIKDEAYRRKIRLGVKPSGT